MNLSVKLSIEPSVELFFEMGKLVRSPIVLSSFVQGAIAVVLIDGGFNFVK
ncbi:hypothetical protein IQ268_28235 [Oculatella sp. LEGE 06141]|uniref:hypothetical protein n=1 Tax=Oculatella sp. LEGE 06141 TaxID=1828648 RepID=UPI00187F4FBA|nr:hypothetical protein [Oculatella sp. LEGE 06141]MBE9182442.1 hypothetical protein [Oculatella sp. LEGE 06141]